MIDKKKDFIEKELLIINDLRRNIFKITPPIVLLIVLSVISQFFIPFVGAIFFGLMAFILVYKKRRYAAYYPCPNCEKSIGLYTNECRNCNLNFDI